MKTKLVKLEMLRGFAALYVFAGHFLAGRLDGRGQAWMGLFKFGQEAVMLFFLISGFVVYYSTEVREENSFREYFFRRLRRIYPVFVLALAIAMTVAWLSEKRNPADFTVGRVVGNLLMLQDFQDGKPGVWVSTLAGNHPLWSLSYEWWFYMLFFPLWRFVPERGRVYVAGGISLLGFATYQLWPNQASLFALYFIVWWAGAELARTYLRGERPGFGSQRGSLAYLGAVAGLAVAVAVLAKARGEATLFGVHPVLEARHLAAAFLLLCGGLIWARLGWRGFAPLFGGFAWVAPFSYALYVFHLPLAVEARFADGVEPEFLRLACYVTAAFGAAWLADGPLQRAINRWTQTRREPARTRSG